VITKSEMRGEAARKHPRPGQYSNTLYGTVLAWQEKKKEKKKKKKT